MALLPLCGMALALSLGRHAVVGSGRVMSPAPLKSIAPPQGDRAIVLPVGSRVQVTRPFRRGTAASAAESSRLALLSGHDPLRTLSRACVQAVDADGTLLHGSVVEERETGRVRVRFDGWSARFDEWYPVDSPLLTPLATNLVERAALRVATVCLGAHDRLALESSRPPRRGAAGLRLTARPRRAATSTRPAPSVEALRDAVKVVTESSNYVMLGLMGDDPQETVAALRSWQQALGLIQPPLCVLDESGGGACSLPGLPDAVALGELPDSSLGEPAYLKFNSMSGFNLLKKHEGPHRGVIITACLRTGRTHQYGGLPLNLFAT